MKSAPPAELMRGTRFVVWRYEERDGKQTKVPYNPTTGTRTDGTTFAGCTTFSVAQRACEANGYDGVGVVLGKGLAGVDLDKCRKDGNLTTRAAEIVNLLNSYTEPGPSKTGVKIFLKGKKPGPNCRKGDIEIYDGKRFFTLTGNHLSSTPFEVKRRTKELETLYYQVWPKKPASVSKTGHTQPTHNIADSDIIELALTANDGGKFQALWEGDWSEYDSQSEADLALCNKLVFWVGADPQRVDTLFRKSGLMRDKWNRDDYRERTINAAVADTTGPYKPAVSDHPVWIDEDEVSGKSETTETPHLEVVEAQPEDTFEFPNWIMTGAAGDFAKLYANYLEPPIHFFYMAFLGCLGAIVADKLTLASELQPQPRTNLIFLGESADDRKSTAIAKTVDFFYDTVPEGFAVCWGVGSAEGLQERLKKDNKLLLCFDEFKQFVGKCQAQGSVLLPCVNTLFEANRYENHTKYSSVVIKDAYLTMMAACTVQTYENTWSPQFTHIGFNNRLFLVPGTGERKYSLPKKIPDTNKYLLKQKLGEVLRHIADGLELDLTTEAKELYHSWYMNLEKSVHSKRLDVYALRFMSLLAANELKPKIDTDTVEKVIALCNWQFAARQLHDPIGADNAVAAMEEKIRRVLKAKGPLKDWELRQLCNVRDKGLWYWQAAKRNLKESNEIRIKNKQWTLIS